MGEIVFIPGFMQHADAWAPVAARVAERYPSTALEPRTHGFEERVAEILESCQPGSVAVGYSMGGRLALHAAVREPGRLAALVTVGASAGIDHSEERAARRRADEELAAWIEGQPIERVVERWERLPVFATQPEQLVAAQRAGRMAHEPARLAALLRSAGQGACPPLWERLPELGCPLLALAGERDEPYAAAARRMAALVPDGRAALVPEAGHAAHLERPAETARLLLDFLDAVLPACRGA